MYKDFSIKIRNTINKTEIKDANDLADIISRRLIIYKIGEIQMWWNSNIFTNEGLLYMKSMFPNSYPINLIITAMRTAKKVEREYLNNSNSVISFYNLTDEIEDNIEKIILVLCDTNCESIKNIIDDLISIDDVVKLKSVFNEIEEKRPEKIESPIICFGSIKYDSVFNSSGINFKELNNILQPLLLGYQNSEQRLLNVGYYNLE